MNNFFTWFFDDKKSKYAFYLKLFLLNIIISLLIMIIDPYCFEYVKQDLSSISGAVLLILSIPLYWLLSLFLLPIMPFIIIKLSIWKYIILSSLIMTCVIAGITKENSFGKKIYLLGISITYNIAAIITFFSSMNV